MSTVAAPESVPADTKAVNAKRCIAFKAQHGLVVAFFLLIL